MLEGQKVEQRAAIEVSLARILESSGFANADRMRDFLTYVVEESLAGRSKSILGKTIAQDVYGRSADEDGDPNNVVRVEARRLRRCLTEYYETDGMHDQIRIHIDSGGYVPRFEVRSVEMDQTAPTTNATTAIASVSLPRAMIKVGVVLATLFGLILVLFFGFYQGRFSEDRGVTDPTRTKSLERQALLDKSHTTLQASNLAEQARGMTLPLFDIERQKLASEMFDYVIRLDPEYFGGYAGAAQTLGTLAILTPLKADRDAYLAKAERMIATAENLSPTHAWTQSSIAWVAFADRNYEKALRLSIRAAELAPADGFILDTHTLVLLFTGDFASAARVSDPAVRDGDGFERSGYRNIFAAANFHLGSYEMTLNLLDQAGRHGDPVSAPRLAYQAAAQYSLGDEDDARETVRILNDTWPNFRVKEILHAFFRNPAHANSVVQPLENAGWTGAN